MVQGACRLRSKSTCAVTSSVWLTQSLLKSDSQLFQLLVSRVQFLLNLLKLCLQPRVLILCNIVCDLEITIMVLQILFLHLHKVIETLGLRLLFYAKDHLSELLSLEGIKLLAWGSINKTITSHHWALLLVAEHLCHEISSLALRLDVSHHRLLLHLARVVLLILLVLHLLLLLLHHIVVLLDILILLILLLIQSWWKLCAKLLLVLALISGVFAYVCWWSLALACGCLAVFDLLSLRPVFLVNLVLVVNHQYCFIILFCFSILRCYVDDLLFNIINLIFILVFFFPVLR